MGAPLTEAKFNEFLVIFEHRMSGVETRISSLETRISGVETKLDNLEKSFIGFKEDVSKKLSQLMGFQDHESKAIEYELRMILETHLKDRFPVSEIKRFTMDKMYDQYDREITEMDGAFLISPMTPKYNYSRLTRDEMFMMLPMKYVPTGKHKFVLAEAKHHINAKKIKQKLAQFHRIRQLFVIASNYLENPEMDMSMYDPKFIKTLQHHPFMGKIDADECYLYFGAAYWEVELLDKFRELIDNYKKLTGEFGTAKPERKVVVYRKLCKLESSWFAVHNPAITDAEIIAIPKINSVYNCVELILPSGHRFYIPIEKEPEGIIQHVGGAYLNSSPKHKTRKLRT